MADIIKVKKLNDYAVIPFYSRVGDAAFDLVSVENHIIAPQCTSAIGTGLAFEIPSGYEVEVCPRSGISLKTPLRIANAPGTIDENYRGEIKVLMSNSIQQLHNYVDVEEGELNSRVDVFCDFVIDLKGNTIKLSDLEILKVPDKVQFPSFLILKGDKIAQGKFRKVYEASFEVVDELSESNRGDNGFGSSGMNVKSGG